MDNPSDTSLGVSAEDFYESQRGGREGPVALGRRLADLASPSTFPPEQWQAGDPLMVLNQSINSFAVNTLASKMMLGAMPPGLPGWKFTPEEHKLDQDIVSDPKLYSEVTYALSRRVEVHRQRLEATSTRTALTKYYKLLLLTGNALVLWKEIDRPVIYNMHNYVVKRDTAGTPLAIVLKESISCKVADEDVLEAVNRNRIAKGKEECKDDWDDEIDIYHVQKLVRDGDKMEYVYWQEVEGGDVIPGTEAWADVDTPTMYAGGMIPEYGSSWYIPYCSDYEGDMQAVENFSSALQDGAAAAARFITLVDPSGQTALNDILTADNLDVVPGREADVKTMRADKGGDLNVTSKEFENASRRLGQAFLMFSAIQRQGERVTAEEWRILAQEIDQAMGGLYSSVSQTSQRYFVLRFIHLHEESDKSLKPLPDGLIRVTVVTGIDSLGQTSESNRLDAFFNKIVGVFGPQVIAQWVNVGDAIRRYAAAETIKADGLVKDSSTIDQEQAAEKQDLMQQSMVDKASGPLAKGGADLMNMMLQQQQKGQTQ